MQLVYDLLAYLLPVMVCVTELPNTLSMLNSTTGSKESVGAGTRSSRLDLVGPKRKLWARRTEPFRPTSPSSSWCKCL